MRMRGNDTTSQYQGPRRLLLFARLAVAALVLGVLAVPVTCAEAHGPHSLFAPPDEQASSGAATLASQNHAGLHKIHALIDGLASTSEHAIHVSASTQPRDSEPNDDDGRPNMNAFDLGFLVLGQQGTLPSSEADAEPLPGARLVRPDVEQSRTSSRFDLEPPPPR
ncbi:MAG: hypothetical protein AB7G88_09875 [Thermomicrobiales bacterium]